MVVSLANITPSHGSRYYAQEGNTVESQQASVWSGNLTEVLGLAVGHPVEPEVLTFLLQGKTADRVLINKTRLHHEQGNSKVSDKPVPVERAGIDLTASAPKSISIQALVFGECALETAHQNAIAQMLQVLENRYAMTRITLQGERQKIVTGKLLIAQFQHNTSRALDPQLHTHNLILNLTQRPDGRWQCLDNEAIYRAKMLLGMIYRNELAREVQALGYEIQIIQPQHGLWELQGFSAQQLAQFSKRAEQIQAAVGDKASSKRKAQAAVLSGRAKKQSVSSELLATSWQQQAKVAGLDTIIPNNPQIPPLKQLWDIAQGLVHRAIAFCSHIAQVFRREDLEKAAMREGMGQTSFATIAKAIDQSPELIAFCDKKRRIRYTPKGDGCNDPLQNASQREAKPNESPTHYRESTNRNDCQSAQTPLRRLFAALHIQSNRQSTTSGFEPESGNFDRSQSSDRRPDQSIDEALAAVAQGYDDAIPTIDSNSFRTDDLLEQFGLEPTNVDQSISRYTATANPDQRDPATNSTDEPTDKPADAQFQQNSANGWEPSL